MTVPPSAGSPGPVESAAEGLFSAAKSQGDVLTLLEELRDPALSRLPFPKMLDELLTRLRGALGADTATFLFLDRQDSVLVPVASQGVSLELMRDFRIPLGRGFAGRVAAGHAPVLVEDVSQVEVIGDALPSAGVKSLLGVPLVVEDRVIGVAHVGWRKQRRFGEGDVRLLMAAGERAAWAIDHGLLLDAERGARAAAEATADRLRRLQAVSVELAAELSLDAVTRTVIERGLSALGAVAGGMWVLDEASGVLLLQGAVGYPQEVVERWARMSLDVPAPAVDAATSRQRVLLRGEAERDARYPHLAGRASVGELFVTVPLTAEGRLLGVLGASFANVDALDTPDAIAFLEAATSQCAHALDRARLLAVERRARERLELLAEAGRLFAAPLDVVSTAADTCRLLVSRVADAAAVHVLEPDGRFELVAVNATEPDWIERFREVSDALPAAAQAAMLACAESGEPVLRSVITAEAILGELDDPADVAALESLALRSTLMLPLRARGRAIGVLTLATMSERPPLDDDTTWVMSELAGRLALALENARLFRQQSDIAHTLQRSLLPAMLPEVPGADVAVRYLPGTEGVKVGGDFYDVIPLPSGRIGLVVGDVMGRGVRAAAVMGQVRAAIRSYTLEGHPPAALLSRLDRLVEVLEDGLLVTCFYGEWDPIAGTVLCSVAGHLPPLLRLPGRAPTYIEVDPGVPLGVGASGYTEVEVDLPPGSLLLAYTDGLVEGPDLPVEDGMARLAAAVAGARTAMSVCDAALFELRPGMLGDEPTNEPSPSYDDDTALLALMTRTLDAPVVASNSGPEVFSTELAAESISPGRARIVVADTLVTWGLQSLVDTATLLVSELVTNGVRHAGTGMRLDLTRLSSDRVRVAVTDHAPDANVKRRDKDTAAEGGRGLFLVEELSAGWGSAVGEDGKTVWFELRR